MLTLENLELNYDDFSLRADLTLPAGGLVALIGPSGAGKSTLLSALGGFQPVAKGRVLWRGREITDIAPVERPVATLFQDNNLFPHLTVAQNLGLALRPGLRLSSDEAARVAQMLDAVGLTGMGGRKPGSLSGGQQSRAALARLLLQGRPVALLDEPFAALGPALRSEMLALVRARLVAPEQLVIMVTHDPRDAMAVADQVVLVADGVVHPPLATAQAFADPPPALRAYLG